MDPILNNVLNRETHNSGARVLISLGDQDVDFSPAFEMYMCTRDFDSSIQEKLGQTDTIMQEINETSALYDTAGKVAANLCFMLQKMGAMHTLHRYSGFLLGGLRSINQESSVSRGFTKSWVGQVALRSPVNRHAFRPYCFTGRPRPIGMSFSTGSIVPSLDRTFLV